MALPLILRWPKGDPPPADLVRQAAIDRVAASPLPGAVTEGLWPGVTRTPNANGRGDETASASREPWVDANGYLVQFHRALKGGVPLLAYEPAAGDRVLPYESLELALIEARVNGGNFALTLEAHYRDALLKKEPKALAAWKSLGESVAWLKARESSFGHPPLPAITMLVEPGPTEELANLMFRRGASPRLSASVPKPSPDLLVLVAASLKAVPAAAFDHARAGATVVIDSPPDPSWKVARKEEDRTLYAVGRGFVLAYHKPVEDPSEFALDVIDVVTHKRRPARIWNALAAIPLATTAPSGAYFHLINYGSSVEGEVQARVQKIYREARLSRPGHPDMNLKIYTRGTQSEVFLPRLDRVASVQFV